MIFRTSVLAFSVFAFAPAGANETALSGTELKSLVEGRRLFLATPLGGELPLFYRPDGVVNGTGEAIGLGRFFRPTDSGRWWISGNRLCQRWQVWYDGATMCFTAHALGQDRIRWRRENGESGIARVGR